MLFTYFSLKKKTLTSGCAITCLWLYLSSKYKKEGYMTQLNKLFALPLVIATLFLAAILASVAPVHALSSSSLLLGDPRTGETTTYTFSSSNFTTATSIQCINIELNTQADGAGSAVPGIDTTSSTLDSSTVITAGSWTVDNGTNSRLRITNAGGENPSANGDIVFGAVDNGTTEGATYFAILTTYTDTGCSTPASGVDTTVVAFTYTDGELVQLTIDPTLTFSVNTVGSGVDVNGVNTTVASSASGINFGNSVTQSVNGVSAHELEVGTNATGGYSVFIRHTGNLSNGSDTIANHTGTNAVPTSFPAAGTEAWGYTTEDGDLTQFGSDEWAGFTTSNEVVMENGSAVSGTETTEVGHQVGVASTTPAGTYQTTIIYTVASTY